MGYLHCLTVHSMPEHSASTWLGCAFHTTGDTILSRIGSKPEDVYWVISITVMHHEYTVDWSFLLSTTVVTLAGGR